MLRYRIKKAKKITPEFLDALKIYLHIDGIDMNQLKQSCVYFKIYGMNICKFLNCDIDLSFSDDVVRTSELFSLKDLLQLYGKAKMVTTPKMTFVDFENIKTTIKNHVIESIKTNDSYWCPYELTNFEYNDDKLIKFIEYYSNGNPSRKFVLHHYFNDENYFVSESCRVFHTLYTTNDNITVTSRNAFGPVVYNKFNHSISSYIHDASYAGTYTKCIIDNTYDENDNLIKIQFKAGRTICTKLFYYDSIGNCIKEQYLENNTVMISTVYIYTFKRNKINSMYKNIEHKNGRVFKSMLFKRRG